MPFDPALPINGSQIIAAELRDQFNGLRALIDSVPQGEPGVPGPPGTPGEVSVQDLVNERINHARNPSSVAPLGLTVSDPPTQAEIQAVASKVDELLAALLRVV